MRIWPLDIYIYVFFTRRRRAQRARVVATLRSEGPSTYYHPLPPQNGFENRAGRRLNAIINWAVTAAMHAVVAIQSPTTSPRPNTNRPAATGNWRLAGEWLRARHPPGIIQAPKTRTKEAISQGRRHRPVCVAFRLRTVRACALAPAPGRGLLWARSLPAPLLWRCGWLRAPLAAGRSGGVRGRWKEEYRGPIGCA